MRTSRKILISLVAIIVIGVGWYGISPLFNNVEVNDALPEQIKGKEGESANISTTTSGNTADIPKEENNEPNISEIVRSPVMGTTGHPASGFVRVVETEAGTIIRYEDFETINGPNLHAYLAKDIDANEYIDLGPIKGTKGNINYSVPEGVDISEYQYVMYWCVPFSVLFNYAEI